MLRWRADDLADASKIGIATIRRAEGFDGQTNLTDANDAAIRRAFLDHGIEFIQEIDKAGNARYGVIYHGQMSFLSDA